MNPHSQPSPCKCSIVCWCRWYILDKNPVQTLSHVFSCIFFTTTLFLDMIMLPLCCLSHCSPHCVQWPHYKNWQQTHKPDENSKLAKNWKIFQPWKIFWSTLITLSSVISYYFLTYHLKSKILNNNPQVPCSLLGLSTNTKPRCANSVWGDMRRHHGQIVFNQSYWWLFLVKSLHSSLTID